MNTRFYIIKVTKVPIGTAIEHREPDIQGEIIIKVSDHNTQGDYRLVVIDCTDEQHQANESLADVMPVTEKQAIEIAAQYQPERTETTFNDEKGEEEEITIPALDLRDFMHRK